MTQPWWPGAGEPPTASTAPQQAPWMPPPGATVRPANQPQQPAQWQPQATVRPAQGSAAAPTANPAVAGGPTGPQSQQVPPRQPNVPGLGFVTFLLVIGTFAFGFFVVREWVTEWAVSIDSCLDGGGAWDCLVNDTSRSQVLIPVVAMIGALCLARGAGVERKQGRGIGWLYALLGFLVLVLAWSAGGM